MTSIKRAGRIATFGFAVGAGLLIAAGAGAAAASAAPEDTGHTSTASGSTSNSGAASARSARPSTGAPARSKPTSKVSASSDHSAPVIQLQTRKRAAVVTEPPAQAATPAIKDLSSTSSPTVKQPSAQGIPTAARMPRAALNIARELDTLRRNIEVLIRHQIEDLRDNLTTLRYDLASIIGPARRPTNPDLPADETPGVIGTPRSREGYFIYQGDTNTCALSTAAMLIGQLYGRDAMPTWEQIVNEAANTPSYSTPGKPIYDRVNDTFVSNIDVLQLLQTHGVTANSTNYTRGQGALALTNLKTALTQGAAVAVAVKSDIVWGRGAPATAYTSDHLITVLGIDTDKNLVYVNDSAWEQSKGMGMALPMDVFMRGWAADSYNTFTAVPTAVSQNALAA